MGCGQFHGHHLCWHRASCACFHCEPSKLRPLAQGLSIDGRPVAEPPILDYSRWIGDEYEKLRAAAMKYTNNDVVQTTRILDVHCEYGVLIGYMDWIEDNWNASIKPVNQGSGSPPAANDDGQAVFWDGLSVDLYVDLIDVSDELMELNVVWERTEDEAWIVKPRQPESALRARARALGNRATEGNASSTSITPSECASHGEESTARVVKPNSELEDGYNHLLNSSATPIPTAATTSTEVPHLRSNDDASGKLEPERPAVLSEEAEPSLPTQEHTTSLSELECQVKQQSDLLSRWWQAATDMIRHMN